MSKDTCNYPDCNCPFEEDSGATPHCIHNNRRNDPTIKDSLTVADALGSLPVVAWRLVDVDDGSEMLLSWRPTFHEGSGDTLIPLTDHAQATAEIAKRDAYIAEIAAACGCKACPDKIVEGIASLKQQISQHFLQAMENGAAANALRAKLAWVDGLARCLSDARKCAEWHIGDGDECGDHARKTVELIDSLIGTYEAAQGEKESVL